MLIGFILALIFAVIILLDSGSIAEFLGWVFLGGIILGGTGAVIISLPLTYVFADDYTETHDIVSLKDSTGSGGGFFLGSGSLDGEATFFYYQENDEGLELKSVDADAATIIISDETPHVTRDCIRYNSNFFTWPIATWPTDYECYEEYKIYVPADSITTEFILDAE